MHIQARRAVAIAAWAMAALEGHWAERARLASAAKVTAAEAGRFVGQNAVQLHGGMGMTDELPIATLFRRLTVIEHELGSRTSTGSVTRKCGPSSPPERGAGGSRICSVRIE